MKNNKLTSIIKDKHGEEWSITSRNVYEAIIASVFLYKKIDQKHTDLADNLAGQLQFLEFTELLIDNFDFVSEGEVEISSFGDFSTEGVYEVHNEIEQALYKQAIIVVASIAEALCGILIESNDILNPKDFKDKIVTLKSHGLIDRFESDLLHSLRKLRNSLHLQGDSYDLGFFHHDQFVTAKACLYWLLLRLLKIDERIMGVHFPFLPRHEKEELQFEL